ncbi:MAG: hypothetical protein QOE90_867 [Thermoplasmata archaeon]|jgi:hypothetical protein|nr:hypothetical protein [Thermoplasmata archaeon]
MDAALRPPAQFIHDVALSGFARGAKAAPETFVSDGRAEGS